MVLYYSSNATIGERENGPVVPLARSGRVFAGDAAPLRVTLTLHMIRCPTGAPGERRQIAGGQLSIGRGPNNDWILADPDRHLSKRHCQLAFRTGEWLLEDFSANGTFLNRTDRPIGAGSGHALRNGDRISLGAYEFEVRIDAQEDNDDFAPFRAAPVRRAEIHDRQADASFSPDMLDPFAPPPPVRPFGAAADPSLRDEVLRHEGLAGRDGGAIKLPADYDPLAGDEDPFRGPTQSDHAPAIDGAFRPPPPPAAVIPDDWDTDLPLHPAPAAASPPRNEAPEPVHVPERAVSQESIVPPSRPVVPAATVGADTALFAAFIRGAGLNEALVADVSPQDAQKTMERAGAAFRAAVNGLRQVLMARASIKGEFRINQTMIQATGNNPLKFSADDDAALAMLLGLGWRSTRPPAEAIAEALRDMRLHELASISAMQTAVRALLAQFNPAAIEDRVEKASLAVLPGQRKARAWERFEALHLKVSQALSDDFDSVFGKAFARAYEQAIDELSAREDTP